MFEIIRSGHFVSTNTPIFSSSINYGSDCFQLEYCTTSGSEYSINGSTYMRQYGSILLVKPKDSFSNYLTVAPYQCYALHFSCNDDDFIQKYLSKIPTQSFPQLTNEFEQKFQDIIVLVKGLAYSSDSPDMLQTKKVLAITKLKSLILELYIATRERNTYVTSKYTKNISDAQNYIISNFNKNISTKNIAKAAHLSESFTYEQFKKITGKTPHEYITELRLQYARSQLILTSDPISEISLRAGFKNPTYLNNIFKKIEGITPLQYRKNNAKSKTKW